MALSLRIFLLCGVVIYTIIIIYLLRKKNMNIKYILLWLFTALVMFIISVFPGIVFYFSQFIGVINPVNAVFMITGLFALLILLSVTLIVSHLNHDIRRLTQEVSLLEERIRQLEKSHK